MNYAVSITNNFVVPASPLDNVLKFKSVENIKVSFYDFLSGELLTDNRQVFYNTVIDNAVKKVYQTTDHLITCVELAGIYFLYVSLDNSVRSNTNGHPLYTRLNNICKIINTIIKSLDNKCVVFFSESCRPSFSGGMTEKNNLIGWFAMRKIISSNCGLEFITEKRNNEDQSDMSFGISVFCTQYTSSYIATYFTKNILNEGFGSVAVGIKLNTGEIVWGIHFPLDFKGEGENNLGYKAMINLQQVLKEYKGTICAFGDFNTIPGNVSSSIHKAILLEFEFMVSNKLTFFGAYYDTIVPAQGEEWKLIN